MRHAAHGRHDRRRRRLPFFTSFGKRFAALCLASTLLAPVAALAGDELKDAAGAGLVAGSPLSSLLAFFGLARERRYGLTRPLGPNHATPAGPRRLRTKEEREARVARLEVNPSGEIITEPERPIVLMAIPLDARGEAVQGLSAEWESSDPRVVRVTPGGEAVAVNPGAALITAQAGGKKTSVRIIVGERAEGKFGGRKQTSIRAAVVAGAHRSTQYDALLVKASYEPVRPAPPAPVLFRFSEERLPDDETDSLYDPANDVGKPPGRTEPGAMTEPAAFSGTETPASENFSLSLPLVSLSGRGPGVSFALSYNSRVWHQSFSHDGKQHLTYDVDSGWPAPGFRLGYGQLEDQGSHGFTLTDPDGTRRELRRTSPNSNVYESRDGSFVRFVGGRAGGTVTYTDGTRVLYGAAGTGVRSFPVRVTDRDGNFITIGYLGGVGPRIEAVQDALARYVRFQYEGGNLTSITTPKYAGEGGEETTVVRFYYGALDFVFGFSAVTSLFDTRAVTPHAPDAASVIRYVHFPGTGTGYRYDYSPYGMIRQVVQLRAMQPAAFDPEPTNANVTGDGQWAATTFYDYHQGGVTLAVAPYYTLRLDDWAGRTSSAAPVYTFAEGPGLSRVTAPDGTVTETTTLSSTESWKNGLVGETVFKASLDGAVLARTKTEWESGGASAGARPKKVWTTNEAGETRAVVFNLYDAYNNPRSVSEHGFAAEGAVGAELRRTETAYVENPSHLNRRLFHLPGSVRVVDVVNSKTASLVEYSYDETMPEPRGPGAVQGHDQAYNHQSPQYDPSTAYRGNVTTVRAYSDAQTPAAGTTTVSTVRYDILGNAVEQTVNCCRKKTFDYTAAYHFAYPVGETRGDAPPEQLSTGALYDFNTGLVVLTTDENLQETAVSYDAATLRPTRLTRPPGGGQTDFLYGDALLAGPGGAPRYSREVAVTTFETGRTTESRRYFDGRGMLVRMLGSYTDAQKWVTSDVEYDVMGRVLRRSNPYYSAGETSAINPSGLWTANTFDKLGRVTEMTLPDGAKVSNEYAGTVTTATDQAGRRRRSVADALGRLKEVHEPDGAGDLGTVASPAQKTEYDYDALDNLTKVTQAGSYGGGPQVTQVREFRYDSLSRLTHQKQVEAAARLDDSGALSATGRWSGVTKYDQWGNVTDAYDARGVRTHFEYDALNRLKAVTYSGETGVVTPAVTYTYDEARGDAQGQPYFNKGALTSVTTAATADAPATALEYDYDRLGRVAAQRQGVGANTYALAYEYNLAGQLTKQTYPSGRAVTNAYDDAARLLSVSSGTQNYAASLTYAAHGGAAAITLGNGTSEEMEYNSRLQLSRLTLKRGAGAGAEVVQSYAYKYGRVDQATGAVDEAENAGQLARIEGFLGGTPASPAKQWEQRLSYDELGRLEEASERGADGVQLAWQAAYSYDRWGNRYEAQNQTPHLPYVPVEAPDVDRQTNRFAAPTQTTPGVEYDKAGNVIRDTKFRSRQYAYDANGRQVWSALLDGTGAATAAYDALGQRVRTASGGRERIYVYDIAGKVVAEYGPPGGDSGGTSYLFTDHQGSTRAVLDARGRVKARRDYGPFGGEVGAGVGPRTGAGTGGQLYGSLDGTRRQYALTERDAETGLDHAWWRKYDSLAGRWTSPDPYLGSASLGDPQSFNRYTYVGNDPVNFVDPSGLNLEAPGGHSRPKSLGGFGIFSPGMHTAYVVGYYIDGSRRGQSVLVGRTFVNIGGAGGETGGEGPQNPATRPLTAEELAAIRNGLANMLANDNCRAFIDKLVGLNTGQSFDSRSLLGYFDNRAKSAEGGIFFNPGPGGLSGNRGTDNLKVFIGSAPPTNILPSALPARYRASAQIALHELIHAVTKGSDDRLLANIQRLGIVPIYNGKALSPPTGQPDGKPYNDYSGYWNSALGNACFPQGVFKP
jgi:RHS repeat-associated protein